MNIKIWCANNKEVQIALAQLEKQGCMWYGGGKPTIYGMNMPRATIIVKRGILTYHPSKYEDAVSASKLYANLLR